MKIKQYYIYSANLNPNFGTEPRKIRPVVVIQSDVLNEANHPSTIICPITSNLLTSTPTLRINLNRKSNKLRKNSAILVDQTRAIDNKRFRKCVGKLTNSQAQKLEEKIRIILLA